MPDIIQIIMNFTKKCNLLKRTSIYLIINKYLVRLHFRLQTGYKQVTKLQLSVLRLHKCNPFVTFINYRYLKLYMLGYKVTVTTPVTKKHIIFPK